MDRDSTAAREIEVKGALQSTTITSTLIMLLGYGVEKLIEHSTSVQGYLLDLSPDQFDPYVSTTWQFLISLLIVFFGKQAIAGRIKVGDIKGLYK